MYFCFCLLQVSEKQSFDTPSSLILIGKIRQSIIHSLESNFIISYGIDTNNKISFRSLKIARKRESKILKPSTLSKFPGRNSILSLYSNKIEK